MEEKLQVRLTRPALERLIGGDKELEVLLSHSTVKEILDTHLRPVVQRYVQAQISMSFGEGEKYQPFVISDKAKEALTRQVTAMVNQFVADYLAARECPIQQMVDSAVEKQIEPAIQKAVRDTTVEIFKKMERMSLES